MRTTATVTILAIASTIVTGCDRLPNSGATSSEPPEQRYMGRWQVIAAPGGVEVITNAYLPAKTQPAAWRLDTETGALELCYENGGVKCGIADIPK